MPMAKMNRSAEEGTKEKRKMEEEESNGECVCDGENETNETIAKSYPYNGKKRTIDMNARTYNTQYTHTSESTECSKHLKEIVKTIESDYSFHLSSVKCRQFVRLFVIVQSSYVRTTTTTATTTTALTAYNTQRATSIISPAQLSETNVLKYT